MILVGISQCANEQDIIEPWVRHHLRLLDRLFVFYGSVDETERILRSLVAEFPSRLIIESQKNFGDWQSAVMNNLLRKAEFYYPDFVFPLDVDEFIGVGERGDLEDEVLRIPVGQLGLMFWRTYLPSFLHRRVREAPQIEKVVLRTNGRFDPEDWVIGTGNHGVQRSNGETLPSTVLSIPLLHQPIRNREQMLSRAVVGMMAQMVAHPIEVLAGAGGQKRKLFDSIIRMEHIDITNAALEYAQEEPTNVIFDPPTIFDYERKYSDGSSMPALSVIAKAWFEMLKEEI